MTNHVIPHDYFALSALSMGKRLYWLSPISTGRYAPLTRQSYINIHHSFFAACEFFAGCFLFVKIQNEGAIFMSNRKTTVEKIEEAKAKITQYENHMKQLVQKQKAEERKARTKRLCSRAGLLESMLPDTIALTDEQFKNFLERTTANDFGRRMLAGIAKGSGVAASSKTVEAVQGNASTTAQQGGNVATQAG